MKAMNWFFCALWIFLAGHGVGFASVINLMTEARNPYGYPRPASSETNVPLRTSFFFVLGIDDQTDTVLLNSVTFRLRAPGVSEFYVLSANQQFAPGYTGRVSAQTDGWSGNKIVVVNIDTQGALLPSRTYTATVTASSQKGLQMPGGAASWSFTTEPAPMEHVVEWNLDMNAEAVEWRGGFFTGFCKPSFCTSLLWDRIPGYELMDAIRNRFSEHPNAWSLQRNWWITGFEHLASPNPLLNALSGRQPNVVRERETRRITAIEAAGGNTVLHVEDFFGHEQYGIESNRPLSPDYEIGNEVLIADGQNHALAHVVAVNDVARTVTVTSIPTPSGGWIINYRYPLPTAEDPRAPGLFPSNGCYLRKFNPVGTPHYYWGRVDLEEDITHLDFGRRLIINFCDAPGDLSIDGGANTTAKDYAQLHDVVWHMTNRLIERYGDACLDFIWSIGNEPDLGPLFWRTNWDEFQRYYDYTSDAILRAFEDNGYDSNKVYIGGLEFAAIRTFAAARYRMMLGHCSPTQSYPGGLEFNAAYADARLNDRRSKRVEDLCSAHGGRGSPIDFVSVHAYDKSSTMAGNMAHAKQEALDIDPVYFADLAIHSHESCPDWAPPPDEAASDSYLGNGFFSTWCADVMRRQLQKAKEDSRFASGETILTFWPWMPSNFGGLNDAAMQISVDDTGNGSRDRTATVALPILNFLGMTASMGGSYQVLPEHQIAGQAVSGFASRVSENEVRVVLYAHQELDIQARSDRSFKASLTVNGLDWPEVYVQEYRFDKDRNSYYREAVEFAKRTNKVYTPAELAQVERLATLRPTRVWMGSTSDESLDCEVRFSGTGANILVLTPNPPPYGLTDADLWRAYE